MHKGGSSDNSIGKFDFIQFSDGDGLMNNIVRQRKNGYCIGEFFKGYQVSWISRVESQNFNLIGNGYQNILVNNTIQPGNSCRR